MELLLFSSASTSTGFLAHVAQEIVKRRNGRQRALFIPFASVTTSWDRYTDIVREALKETGLEIRGIHEVVDSLSEIARADCIIVGGGNTWRLLKECRDRAFLDAVPKRVRENALYVGWSAGVNMACPLIATTNDMPIVDPRGFAAFGLIDFQINPHYTNAVPEGYGGETRDERIIEFLTANPTARVLGLPESDWLHISSTQAELRGETPAMLFLANQPPREIPLGLLPAF
ncbi:MAG: dipeptidase PepE [Burkholderiales bacterium]|jgi:dipeptidase E|nr:dipeptidase PepE [Burkholderiales bacterium]